MQLHVELGDQVLDFDVSAAERAGESTAQAHAESRPIEIRDIQIAGIIAAKRATLATRNVRHFLESGKTLINPWDH